MKEFEFTVLICLFLIACSNIVSDSKISKLEKEIKDLKGISITCAK